MSNILQRRHNFQTVSWFYDLFTRGKLNLDPPYQRRSVWNLEFKEYFIDTVLLAYPAPSLFIYEEISIEGASQYNVVDGKQRLSTLFEFIRGEFPVSDKSSRSELQGVYFATLPDDIKKQFWSYQFTVEYLPSSDERIINTIFDRINRNVAKLTAQELRHARFSGSFISKAEELAEWMSKKLPGNIPRLTEQTRKQMKDVETVSVLLLLLEVGPKGYSQSDLDVAFSERDTEWESQLQVEPLFRSTVDYLTQLFMFNGGALSGTRLKNQADFYSLFGAISNLIKHGNEPRLEEASRRLTDFCEQLEDEDLRNQSADLKQYYEAARSASNDKTPREQRIDIITSVLIE